MTKERLNAQMTNGERCNVPRAIDGNSGFRRRRAVPEGLCEKSPAFQRREVMLDILSPEGTVESGSSNLSFQPSLRDAVFVANIHSEIASNKEVVNQIAL